MVKRIITGIIGFPLIVAVVYFGGSVLQLSLLALALIGLWEFYTCMSKQVKRIHMIGFICTVVYYLGINSVYDSSLFFIMMTLFIISVLVFMVIFHEKINLYDSAITIFGFFYVAFLLSFIYLVRMHVRGPFFVWLIFICAFGSDTFAYFTGRIFGKHKLCPTLSKNKTVEGAVGGVVGAALIASLYGYVITKAFGASVADLRLTFYCAVIGTAGAVVSIFGDLTASAIKRLTGLKDFGKIFPGHGGVLDRFDSVLFTAPIVYMVMILLMRLGL